MGRRVATAALVVACGGLVIVAMSTTSQAVTSAPTKTSPPPAPPSTTAPATTVWPSTTSVTTATTATTTQLSPTPATTAAATTFDALSFLRDYYAGMASDPFSASVLAEENAVESSPAMAFLFHEAIAAGSIYAHTNDPLPTYTVTADGPAVGVCRNDDNRCEIFSDFVLAGGLLDSFSIDGQSIEQWTSMYERVTTVETLTIDGIFAVRRPSDGLLSVGLLLDSSGGETAFGWEQATYVDAAGRSFSIDAAASEFPGSMEAGGLDVAHVSFAGAEHGGQLSIPITSDAEVFTEITVPVVLPSWTGAGFAPAATAVPTTVAGQQVFEPVGFFTELFTRAGGDPPNSGDLDQQVVPGSPAEAWVNYFLGFASARLDSRPGPFEPFTVTAGTTAVSGEEAVDVCNEGFCDQFSGFVADDDGRLQTFLLNGVAIDDRLGRPSQATDAGTVSVGVVGAFERVTVDELAVVLEFTPAGEEITVAWDEVRYADPIRGDLPVDLPASAYPRVVGPVGAQPVVLQFPVAELGGEVILTFTTASSASPIEARVPVDALRS